MKNLVRAHVFNGSHPEVMKSRVESLDWQDVILKNDQAQNPPKFKHEKLKYRLRSWVELKLLGGKEIGGFKNYKIARFYKK